MHHPIRTLLSASLLTLLAFAPPTQAITDDEVVAIAMGTVETAREAINNVDPCPWNARFECDPPPVFCGTAAQCVDYIRQRAPCDTTTECFYILCGTSTINGCIPDECEPLNGALCEEPDRYYLRDDGDGRYTIVREECSYWGCYEDEVITIDTCPSACDNAIAAAEDAANDQYNVRSDGDGKYRITHKDCPSCTETTVTTIDTCPATCDTVVNIVNDNANDQYNVRSDGDGKYRVTHKDCPSCTETTVTTIDTCPSACDTAVGVVNNAVNTVMEASDDQYRVTDHGDGSFSVDKRDCNYYGCYWYEIYHSPYFPQYWLRPNADGSTTVLETQCGPSGCTTREVATAPSPYHGEVAGQTVGGSTPDSVTVPTLYTLPPVSTPGVGSQTVNVPGVSTPPVPVGYTCTPLGLICVGPTTVPGIPVLPPTTITTPPVDPVALLPSPTPVPPETTVPNPADTTFSVTLGAIEYTVNPNVGNTNSIGPVYTEVPGPFGPIPVIICAQTCPVPVAPGATIETSVTVAVQVGSTSWSHTAPVTITV